MSTAAKMLIFVGVAVMLVVISVLATISIQHWSKAAPVVTSTPAQLAQVIGVVAHVETVSKPVRSCHPTESVVAGAASSGAPIAGTVLGGLAGGLAGSVIHGHGRELAIGAGAALGALTGGAVQTSMHQPQSQVVQSTHCSTSTVTSQVQKGYDVTYLYNGQQGVVKMLNPPALNSLIAPPVAYPPTAPAPVTAQYP